MLLGNGSVLTKLPIRYFGGSTTSVEPQIRQGFGQNGAIRNRMYQDRATTALPFYSLPPGNYPGVAWMLPQKVGDMASHSDASLSVTGAAAGALGVNIAATSGITITIADAAGQLISSGSGTSVLTFSGTGNILATLTSPGSASMAFSTNTPAPNALAWGAGTTMLNLSAALTSYALGSMNGSTLYGGALSEASILAAMNASPPAVNIRQVNSVVITGDGSTGTPWGP